MSRGGAAMVSLRHAARLPGPVVDTFNCASCRYEVKNPRVLSPPPRSAG